MENENMEQDESILTLTDENGQDMDFEYLDCLTYEGKEYLVLMPADEPSTEIVILEVEPVDEENENYLAVEDEAILDAVYGLSRKSKPGQRCPPGKKQPFLGCFFKPPVQPSRCPVPLPLPESAPPFPARRPSCRGSGACQGRRLPPPSRWG